MAGGIDVQHFASVHGMSADIDVDVKVHDNLVADWHMKGVVPETGWRGRAGRWLLGTHYRYVARVGGGSVITLTYGPQSRLGGTGRPLPPLYILWGAVPLTNGVSDVHVFLIAPKGKGVMGQLAARARIVATTAMLAVLNDDDVRAFPHMRFRIGRMVQLDESVAKMVRFLNGLPLSPWSGANRRDVLDDS